MSEIYAEGQRVRIIKGYHVGYVYGTIVNVRKSRLKATVKVDNMHKLHQSFDWDEIRPVNASDIEEHGCIATGEKPNTLTTTHSPAVYSVEEIRRIGAWRSGGIFDQYLTNTEAEINLHTRLMMDLFKEKETTNNNNNN